MARAGPPSGWWLGQSRDGERVWPTEVVAAMPRWRDYRGIAGRQRRSEDAPSSAASYCPSHVICIDQFTTDKVARRHGSVVYDRHCTNAHEVFS
ncbi:MAG: hypothetical protein ACREHD_00265, partial [Pirellulales bacterium]